MKKTVWAIIFCLSLLFHPPAFSKASPQFLGLLGDIRAEIMTNNDVVLGNMTDCQLEMVNNAMAALLYQKGEALLNGALLSPLEKAMRILLTAVGGGLILDAVDLAVLYENARHSPDGLKVFAKGLGKMLVLKGAKILIRNGKARFIKGEKPTVGETAKDVFLTSGGIDVAEDLTVDGVVDPTLDILERVIRKWWLNSQKVNKSLQEEVTYESGGDCKTSMKAIWVRSKKENVISIVFISSCTCEGRPGKLANGTLTVLARVKARREYTSLTSSTKIGATLKEMDRLLRKIPGMSGRTAFPESVIVYDAEVVRMEVGARCCGTKSFATNMIIDEDWEKASPSKKTTTPSKEKKAEDLAKIKREKAKLKKKKLCLKAYQKAMQKIEEMKKKKEKEIAKTFDKALEKLKKEKEKREAEYNKWLHKVSQAKADINIGCDTFYDEMMHQHDLLSEVLQRGINLEYRRSSCLKVENADCSYIDKEISANKKEQADLQAKIKSLHKRWKDCQNGNKKLKSKIPAWERKRHQAYQRMQEISEQIEKLKKKKAEALKNLEHAYEQDKQKLILAKKDCEKTGKWKDIEFSLNWISLSWVEAIADLSLLTASLPPTEYKFHLSAKAPPVDVQLKGWWCTDVNLNQQGEDFYEEFWGKSTKSAVEKAVKLYEFLQGENSWPFSSFLPKERNPLKKGLDAPQGQTKVYTYKVCYTKAELQMIQKMFRKWAKGIWDPDEKMTSGPGSEFDKAVKQWTGYYGQKKIKLSPLPTGHIVKVIVSRKKEKKETVKVEIVQIIPRTGNNPFDPIDPLEGESTTGTGGGNTATTGTTYKGIACGFDTITVLSQDATSAVVSLKDNPNITFSFGAPSLFAGPPHPTIPAQVYEAQNVTVNAANPSNLTMDLQISADTVIMWAGDTTTGWLGCSGEFAKQ